VFIYPLPPRGGDIITRKNSVKNHHLNSFLNKIHDLILVSSTSEIKGILKMRSQFLSYLYNIEETKVAEVQTPLESNPEIAKISHILNGSDLISAKFKIIREIFDHPLVKFNRISKKALLLRGKFHLNHQKSGLPAWKRRHIRVKSNNASGESGQSDLKWRIDSAKFFLRSGKNILPETNICLYILITNRNSLNNFFL
jgi:hypothetical protein